MTTHRFRHQFIVFLLAGISLLAGCGTNPKRLDAETPRVAASDVNDENDPLEGFNRAMFTFNDKLDRYLLKPVAKGYRTVVPGFARSGVSNFFNNLGEPIVFLNNLLQGKLTSSLSDFGRFLTNSTIGIYGMFDVASRLGMTRHDEDFGQTLGAWGLGEGSYLVLPFFGPSSLRDGTGRIVDYFGYPPNYMEETSTRDKLFLARAIDTRAQFLDAGDILDQASGQDSYVFVREAYRQRRLSLIHDGNPPRPPPPDFLFEEETPPTAVDGAKKPETDQPPRP